VSGRGGGRGLVDSGRAALPEGGQTCPRPAGYTALFAAPEQMRRGQADARSDVYSLAATLYSALLYGATERREPHCFKPAFAPPEFGELLTRSLANDPAERPANAREFLAALQTVRHAPAGAG